MSTTQERFMNGVHRRGDPCGQNKSGYAALSAAIEKHDIHQLDTGMTSSYVPGVSLLDEEDGNKYKKKMFLDSDALAYILLHVVCKNNFQGLYIIFIDLIRLTDTMESIISTITKTMSTVMVVYRNGYHSTRNKNNKRDPDKNTFVVKSISSNYEFVYEFDTSEMMISFFRSLCRFSEISVVVYPNMRTEYKMIASMSNIKEWYIPVSRDGIYISDLGKDNYKYHLFPWAVHPRYSGYVHGRGIPILAGPKESIDFMGACSFYEKMISGTPYKDSCIDCYVLRMRGEVLSIITNKKVSTHKHRLSTSSIEALAKLDELMTKGKIEISS